MKPIKHTVLFLAANPLGTDRLALDREARSIQVELERSGYRHSFEFETRWALQPLDLLRELRKLKPTIVHFSGHGGKSMPGESSSSDPRRDVVPAEPDRYGGEQHELFFRGPDGRVQVASGAALAAAFGAAGTSVRLVVLNACYTEAQAETLLEHVDCVVGMVGTIGDEAAISFARGLYGGLGAGESIEAAYRYGQAAVSLEGLGEHTRPRLRVRIGVDPSQLVLAAHRS
jgi:hypothetical protein